MAIAPARKNAHNGWVTIFSAVDSVSDRSPRSRKKPAAVTNMMASSVAVTFLTSRHEMTTEPRMRPEKSPAMASAWSVSSVSRTEESARTAAMMPSPRAINHVHSTWPRRCLTSAPSRRATLMATDDATLMFSMRRS